MKKPPACFTFTLLFALTYILPLRAQTATSAPSGANAKTESSASGDQAPDEMTKKITDLVHAGKYAEAEKLTEGLLIAYPDDHRLIKAKALIQKLLTPASSANGAPVDRQPNQPEAVASAEQRSIRNAAFIGSVWGIGHTITIFIVGSLIILFGVEIPPRLGLSMEFSVAVMLILLGILNLTGVMQKVTVRFTPAIASPKNSTAPERKETSTKKWSDYSKVQLAASVSINASALWPSAWFMDLPGLWPWRCWFYQRFTTLSGLRHICSSSGPEP